MNNPELRHELLDHILNNSSDGIVILRKCVEGGFEALISNQAAFKLMDKVNLTYTKHASPEGQIKLFFDAELSGKLDSIPKGGAPLNIEAGDNSNGRQVWVRLSASACKENIILTLSDVTYRKESEKDLQTEIYFNELILESLPYPVALFSSGRKVRRANSSFVNHNRFFNEIGHSMLNIIKSFERASGDNEKNALEFQCGGSRYLFEFDSQNDTGLIKKASFSSKIWNIFIKHIHEDVYLFYAIDETDRYAMEDGLNEARAQAEKSNIAKSRFIANMSHEIRTPLNGIIGFSELLFRTSVDHQQSQYLNNVKTCAGTLLNLINDILDFSKIEAEKVEIESSEFILKQALLDVITIVKFEAGRRSQNISTEFAGICDMPLLGDIVRLKQVVLNLVNNAIKFTPENKTIKLIASLENETEVSCDIKISVIDEGIGISEENQKKLFSSFIQADASHTRKFGGTGLGLVISEKLVRLMGGGGIKVMSAVNEGSCFSFVLPFLKAQPSSESRAGEERIDWAAELKRLKLKILIVDDSEMNLNLGVKMLKMLGCTVSQAADGPEAIEKAMSEQFDLILMDVCMPLMDGYETTTILRQKNIDTPIIALTASALKSDVEYCFECGMNAYLSKPIVLPDLTKTLCLVYKSRKYKKAPSEKHNETEDVKGAVKREVFDYERFAQKFSAFDEKSIKAVSEFMDTAGGYINLIDEARRSGDNGFMKLIINKFKAEAFNISAVKLGRLLAALEDIMKRGAAVESASINELRAEIRRFEDEIRRTLKLKVKES
ncbi:MAG: Sensory/regulatory protein RpfC [bacterium ADurb.Bin243]|nr:MAG: Sensory/regulatory protein RpfC [bacterium ADurb.Bin243]HOD40695.1 response regulator [Candidatus Wallbacteria bacterium]